MEIELAVCEKHGISHSHFHGGPARWTQADRDKAVWRHLRESDRCKECGTRHAEWEEKQGGDPRAYRAKKVRCYGCEQVQGAQASIDEKRDGKGMGVSLVRR